MIFFIPFLPLLSFVLIFVGSGLYFSLRGISNAFYQLSPVTAILPSLVLGWILHKGTAQQKVHDFLEGVRHRDIITMCLIFLLAGAFSEVTKHIGSVEATVNLALSFIPSHFLIPGIFLVAAFISTAIGTSLGTIATMAPLAATLSTQAQFSPALGMATVVGGAMFGDNLSLISDTTIAAVMSQEADMKKKLKLNAKIALIASLMTVGILFLSTQETTGGIPLKEPSLILVLPYIFLILLAMYGVNVFVTLVTSLLFAGGIGVFSGSSYGIIPFSQDLNKGFLSMNEIMLLSLLVGGLSGLAGRDFVKQITDAFSAWLMKRQNPRKWSQLLIAKWVSFLDILLGNNTIAIILSGEVAREVSKKYKIPPHYMATWLDTFSCIFQGIIPYGAQILLASAIGGVSPLSVTPHVYYCYVLWGVSILCILFERSTQKGTTLQPETLST